jgi:hypothetical protein
MDTNSHSTPLLTFALYEVLKTYFRYCGVKTKIETIAYTLFARRLTYGFVAGFSCILSQRTGVDSRHKTTVGADERINGQYYD